MNKLSYAIVYISISTLILSPFLSFSQIDIKKKLLKDTSNTNVNNLDKVNLSKDSLLVFSIKEENLKKNNYNNLFLKKDTSITNFHNQSNFYKNHNFFAGLGNEGLPETNLIFPVKYRNNKISPLSFLDHYFFSYKSADYYKAITPFSDVFFTMGPKRQQILNALFTRNLGKQINLMANYAIIFSPGIYKFQKSNNNHVIINSNFRSRNNRYLVIADYFYNRMVFQQNGGIKYDTAFTENSIGHDVMEVNLKEAESKMKESGFYFRQFFSPGFTKNNKDTIKENDQYIAFGRFSHSFLIKNQMAQYKDKSPLSGFYQRIYLDSTNTNDSVFFHLLENRLEWSNTKFNIDSGKFQKFLFSFSVKHRLQQIFNNSIDTTFNSFIPEASLDVDLSTVIINFNGFYTNGGYQNKDFSGTAFVTYSINKNLNHSLDFEYNFFKQKPVWTDQHYISNHFIWDNDFDQINVNKVSFRYQYKRNSIKVIYSNIKNFVYYDYNALPKQNNNKNKILQIELNKKIEWKKWNFNNHLVFQNVTGNNIIRIPDFLSSHTLYYSNNFLKKALFAQIGAEVTIIGSYLPLAYMPATGLFYNQNIYKSKIYNYIDFFVDIKIKHLRLFLKLDHLNSGIQGYNYFSSLHYPNNDRCFRIGLSWIFYN